MTILRRAAALPLLSLAVLACQTPTPDTAAKPANAVSCRESYLDVKNPSREPLDIYAYISGLPTYIATASPGQTTVSLAGTPLENKGGALYGVQDGHTVTNAGVPSSTFTITRRCQRASGSGAPLHAGEVTVG